MTFGESINTCLNKYATMRGRAPRSEFWWFVVFYWIAQIVTSGSFFLIGMLIGGEKGGFVAGMIGYVLVILTLVCPYLCVLVRRLHDTGHSGALLLITLIPIIGGIGAFVILFFLIKGSDEENEYGLPVY